MQNKRLIMNAVKSLHVQRKDNSRNVRSTFSNSLRISDARKVAAEIRRLTVANTWSATVKRVESFKQVLQYLLTNLRIKEQKPQESTLGAWSLTS